MQRQPKALENNKNKHWKNISKIESLLETKTTTLDAYQENLVPR